MGRLLAGLIAKRYLPLSAQDVTINGEPGLWLARDDGTPYAAISLGFTPDGARVAAIYVVRNPDKLRRPPR